MDFLGTAQGLVLYALTLAAFAICVWALVDALRRPAAAFEYAGKRTKRFWSILLAVAVALAFVSIGGGFFFVVIAVVAAGVYLADVRPAVRTYGGGGAGGRGPYGGW
ncbi:DUF2516 family protein [Aquipuribacter sp. SD81]|uniref:DUF2516 family protein n=1 Tax=Aquipuribacter sp. SD81 TaxID=3127703 RepID=UPI003015C2B4